MGEAADAMLEGEACALCGVELLDGEADGYPRYCCVRHAVDAGVKKSEAKYLCEGWLKDGKVKP